MVMARDRDQVWLRRLQEGGVIITKTDPPSVRLDPIPSDDGTDIVFSYHADRYASWGAIEGGHIEKWITLCEHHLHKRLATGAGAVTEVEDKSEGSRIKTDAAKYHRDESKDALKKYQRSRPPISLRTTFP